MFQGEGNNFEFKKDETEYKQVEELDLEDVAKKQKEAKEYIEWAEELARPPKDGVAILLSGSGLIEVREKIRVDKKLTEYYGQARGTLNGGKNVPIDRGRIINQMFNEIPPTEPEHRERLIQLIRETIIHPLL